MWALYPKDGTMYPARIKAYKDNSKYIIYFSFLLSARQSTTVVWKRGKQTDPR